MKHIVVSGALGYTCQ